MNRKWTIALFASAVVVACSTQKAAQKPVVEPLPSASGLSSTTEFASIEDDASRSRALFQEMGKVLQHPRCVNCHPAGERPLQGDEMLPHQPLVVRGEDGFGAPGMRCTTCHGEMNYKKMPGHPVWHLAPPEMAWEGKSLNHICEQLKDPNRNGGHTLDGIVKHMANDDLVGWGWNPPEHLEPAPGNQALLGQLTQAWVEAGAHCPE